LIIYNSFFSDFAQWVGYYPNEIDNLLGWRRGPVSQSEESEINKQADAVFVEHRVSGVAWKRRAS
jgi:hypothetical protein